VAALSGLYWGWVDWRTEVHGPDVPLWRRTTATVGLFTVTMQGFLFLALLTIIGRHAVWPSAISTSNSKALSSLGVCTARACVARSRCGPLCGFWEKSISTTAARVIGFILCRLALFRAYVKARPTLLPIQSLPAREGIASLICDSPLEAVNSWKALGRQARATLETLCESIYYVQRVGLNLMKMNPITFLILLFSGVSGVPSAQANQAQGDELVRLVDTSSCRGNCQSGEMVCETVLPRSVGTKKNKTGDHILIPTYLVTSSAEEPITMLDAAIVEVQSRVNDRSVLRIRIEKALRKDGREVTVEANIVALASQSGVTEGWRFPSIIVDRFPRIPEDDQRLPGERKLSEDQRQTSPLDSVSALPVHYKVVCPKKEKKTSVVPCKNLLEARGVYRL